MSFLSGLLGGRRKLSNPKLEHLMENLARGDTPEGRRHFYRELLRCRLALATPGRAAREPQSHPTGQGMTIHFVAATGPDGGQAMLAFSSGEALLAWRPVGCDHVVAEAKALFGMAVGSAALSTIVINPKGPRSGGYLTRPEFSALAQGRLPELPSAGRIETFDVAPGMPITFAPPAIMLDAKLVAVLCDAAARHPPVKAVHLVVVGFGAEPPRNVVAVEHAPGEDPERVITPLLHAIQPIVGEGAFLDMLPVATGSGNAEEARKTGSLLFERPRSA
jgi:hypothetical protein